MEKRQKTGGRQKGTPNKINRAFKEAVTLAYENIGGDGAFAKWAKENPTEFYKIAARLIPAETNISGTLGTYSAQEIPVEPREPDPVVVPAGTAAGGNSQGLH